MKGHSKWFITKSIGIVPELFASRILFVFLFLFSPRRTISTQQIFSVNFNVTFLDTKMNFAVGTIHMNKWTRAHKNQVFFYISLALYMIGIFRIGISTKHNGNIQTVTQLSIP